VEAAQHPLEPAIPGLLRVKAIKRGVRLGYLGRASSPDLQLRTLDRCSTSAEPSSVTTVPSHERWSNRPSSRSLLSASRTGVGLTPRWAPSSFSFSREPGHEGRTTHSRACPEGVAQRQVAACDDRSLPRVSQ
jgi:hypothetical protein